MKKETTEIIMHKLIPYCLIFLIIISVLAYGFQTDNQLNKYCQSVFPSENQSITRGFTINIEPGFIKCCRNYYKDHEKENECEVFPYTK